MKTDLKTEMDERQRSTREVLRIVGPGILLVGLIFTVIGFGSFFASFGSFEPPSYFWCAFVGLPLLMVGIMVTSFAFLGATTRYMANEVAPVGKDTFNYMATGTKDAVRELASAVGEGLRGNLVPGTVEVVRCQKCNEENEVSARFCKSCGGPLAKTVPCPSCGELNDPDARFCDNCGKPLGA